MKVNLGKYSSKNKIRKTPDIIGPRRRIDRKALAQEIINKRQDKKKSIPIKKISLAVFIIILITSILGALWKFNDYKSRVQFTDNNSGTQICDNIFNPKCWTEAFKPNFKQTDNFTNALLVGIDARPEGDGADLKNTDTIIIASINHKTKKVMLLSIPRDMVIPVYIDEQLCCSAKINSVYALQYARNDVEDGMKLLASNIENLLDIKIHYTAQVDFVAVKEIVDAVGGVQVDIKDNLTVTYPEETPPYNYSSYSFKQGLQTLDGKNALVYSRFRYVQRGPAEYASDFSRSDRQQQVIDGLKEKILADEGGLNDKADKYWKIYQSLEGHLTVTDINFLDILAALTLVDGYDKNPVNVVLDPNFGGLNNYIKTGTEEGFGYHILAVDNTWSNIRERINNIWEYPEVFDDEAIITLVNRTSRGLATDSPMVKLQNEDIPFYSLNVITESKNNNTGIIIYDFSNGGKNRTVNFLKNYFGNAEVITNPIESGIKKSAFNEDIKVEFNQEVSNTNQNP